MEQFTALKHRRILIVLKNRRLYVISGIKVSVVSIAGENVSPMPLLLLFCKSIGDTNTDTTKVLPTVCRQYFCSIGIGIAYTFTKK